MRGELVLNPVKQARQTRFQPFGDLFKIHQRNVPHPTLYAAVVCPVEAATLRCLFLIDLLLLANAADGTTKPDANIERHWLRYSGSVVDA